MATVTDEGLVASIMAAIEAAPPTGGLSLTYEQVEYGVRAALAARSTVTDEEYWQLKCLSVNAVSTPSTVTDEHLERLAEGRRMFVLAAATLERDALLHGLIEDEQNVLVGAVLNAADRTASGHTALLRENKALREALLTAQLLTVAHRKRVEDKLDAILQALSESKPGENG
jgi:hypothetical protein